MIRYKKNQRYQNKKIRELPTKSCANAQLDSFKTLLNIINYKN